MEVTYLVLKNGSRVKLNQSESILKLNNDQ